MGLKEKGLANIEAIKVLKFLLENNATPSEEQRQVLMSFSGWGTLASVFDQSKNGWRKDVRESLLGMLTHQEYMEAKASTYNAHYTTKEVIEAIWSGLGKLGVTGKLNALEPGCGTGRFIEYCPKGISPNWFGIERDIIPAQIAELLHPNAVIINGVFQDFKPTGKFDLVIGNVPFGNVKVDGFNLHNYFVNKSIDLTRYGGWTVLITTSGTLDARTSEGFRKMLSSKANLVGAMRLPNAAFKEEGTSVTTDILFFQKGSNENPFWIPSRTLIELGLNNYGKLLKAESKKFLRSNGLEGTDDEISLFQERLTSCVQDVWWSVKEYPLNGYYLTTPIRLLGRLAKDPLYGGRMGLAEDDQQDLYQRIIKSFESFNVKWDKTQCVEMEICIKTEADNHPVGDFFSIDGVLFLKDVDDIKIVDAEQQEQVEKMLELYASLDAVIQRQKKSDEKESDRKELLALRRELNESYDSFIEKYGYLNAASNIKILGTDSRYYLLMALEVPSEENVTSFKKLKKSKEHFGKADIFFRRTASPRVRATTASNIKEAIFHSLNEYGKINISYISDLRVIAEKRVVMEMTANKAAFWIPSKDWGNISDLSVEEQNEDTEDIDLVEELYLKEGTVVCAVNWNKASSVVKELTLDEALNDWQSESITKQVNAYKSLKKENALMSIQIDSGHWIPTEEYLSGNVRKKLVEALEFDFPAENIAALESVIPQFLLPNCSAEHRGNLIAHLGIDKCDLDVDHYFDVALGATWVPSRLYKEFAEDLIGWGVDVRYIAHPVGKFTLSLTGNLKIHERNTRVWGVSDAEKTFEDLFQVGLQQQQPRCYVEINGKSVFDAEATNRCRIKLDEIKNHFKQWIVKDYDRCLLLTELYNQKFSGYVTRKYDGSFLQLPGSNPEFHFRKHQLDAIWRILANRTTLLGHCVGAGKTAVMIASCMEMRRLGLAKKPMLVVKNSTISQVEAEFRHIYPTARLLVSIEKSLSPENRKRFCARIATGDWDAVIITHTQFQRIPLSPENSVAFLSQELNALEKFLGTKDGKPDSRTIKEHAKARDRVMGLIELAMNKVEQNQDIPICFEDLGVDTVFVDEAHIFKNLPRLSNVGFIKGLPSASFRSQNTVSRAFDGYMKIRWLESQPSGRIVFATGTPVSNSIAEAWVMLKFLAPELLESAGIAGFDECLSTFFEIRTQAEMTPTGYKNVTRCSRVKNLPEFMKLWRTVVDIVDKEQLGFPVPEMKVVPVTSPSSPEQLEYMQFLIKRLDLLQKKKPLSEGGVEDLYITVQGDARAAFGLDLRLKVKDAGNFVDSKLNKCVSNIYRIWEASKSVKAVQAVFINARAPEEDGFFNSHVYMRDALRDLGIPSREIAFVHDYDTAEKRKELFYKINEGEIRVVFGSAEKLGTGTNIQKRMIAIHQVDCPWIPALIEQQIGRIIRQGNIFGIAFIFNYLTQGEGDKPGFDSYIWGVILKKLQFITQLMSGDETTRRQADDIGEMQVSASQMMALASGNPAYERWFNLEQEIKALEMEKKQKDSQYIENQVLRTKATLEIDNITDKILPGAKQDLAEAQGRKKSLVIKRKEFDLSDETNIKDAVEAIRGEFLRAEALSSGNNSAHLAASHCGELDGFKIRVALCGTQFRLLLVGEKYSYWLPTKSKEQIKETLLAPIASFIKVEIKSQEAKLKELKETVKSLGLQSCVFTKEEELKTLLEEQRLLKIELFPEELTESDSESPKESDTLVLGEAQPSFEFKPSPCPYNGVETEIVEALKQRLIDETPEWMEDIYSACKNVAEKETEQPSFIEWDVEWDAEWNPDDYNDDETPDIDFECWEDEDDEEDENFIGIENPDDELYDQLFD